MKGLVRYDLTQLTGNSKRSFYLLYFAGLIVVSLAVGGGKIFSYMAVMIGCMMGVSFFSYETWYHWDRYCAALPLSNRQIVVSRYISLLITTGCGVLLGFVIGLLSFAAGRMELSWTQWLFSLVQTILAALLYIEIEIPVMYRFGVERGRLQYSTVCCPVFRRSGIGRIEPGADGICHDCSDCLWRSMAGDFAAVSGFYCRIHANSSEERVLKNHPAVEKTAG